MKKLILLFLFLFVANGLHAFGIKQNTAGIATTANYATNANYANTANTANYLSSYDITVSTSNYSVTSNYALLVGLNNTVSTSNYASTANTLLSNDITVSTANYAITANYASTSNAFLSTEISITTLNISGQIVSSLATGTAPLSVQSTTKVSSLNVGFVSDYPFDITTPTSNQVLIYNGTSWVNRSIPNTGAGAGVYFYLDDVNSGIGTYNQLLSTPNVALAEQIDTVTCNSAIINPSEAYISAPLSRSSIEAGEWEFTMWSMVDSSTGVSDLRLDLYIYSALGVKTFLFSVYTPEINATTTVNEYIVSTTQSNFNLVAGDRLLMEIFGRTTSAGTRTISFAHNGTAHYSFLKTPISLTHNSLPGLNLSPYYHSDQPILVSSNVTFAGITTNALSVNASADVTVNVGYVKLGTRTGAGVGRATFGHKTLGVTEQALVQTSDGITLLNTGIGKQINFSLGNAIKGTLEPAGNWIFGSTASFGSGIVQINGNTLASGNINCLGTITANQIIATSASIINITGTITTANWATTANAVIGSITTANTALAVSVNGTNQVLGDMALQASNNVTIGSLTISTINATATTINIPVVVDISTLNITGFTQLGGVKIRTQIVTGNTGANQGDVVTVSLASLGITAPQIVGLMANVFENVYSEYFPPSYSDSSAGREYYIAWDVNNINLKLSASNSSGIRSDVFSIVVFYTE